MAGFDVVFLMIPLFITVAVSFASTPIYTLPLTLPGVVAGWAFTFSLAVSMYVIPSLIVGERQQTLSMLIARSYLYLRNEQLGSTISAVLLVISIAVVLGSSWLAARMEGPRR